MTSIFIRTSRFTKLLLFVLLLLAAVFAAPYIGLGRNEEFILYKLLHITRGQVLACLTLLGLLLCLWRVMTFDVARAVDVPFLVSIGRATSRATVQAAATLFAKTEMRREAMIAATVAVFFALLFLVLLSKTRIIYEDLEVVQWSQIFIDYDLDWKTPRFSLAGNVLNHFGIQPPFNTNLSPLLGLAHAVGRNNNEIALSVVLFYCAMTLLLWFVGRKMELRAVACVIFAALAALIVTVPYGLDRLLYVVPPYLLTSTSVLTRYWEEVSILSLATSFLFFLLGQYRSSISNLALALGFGATFYIVVLSFPAAAFFSVPVIGLYCLAFLTTVENSTELLWKSGGGISLAVIVLLTNLPMFLRNLYSYTFGAYFSDSFKPITSWWVATWDTLALLKHTSMFTAFLYEPRVAFVLTVSVATAVFVALRSSGSLRRIAMAVVLCELGIILFGVANAFFLHNAVSLNYAEQLHLPFLVGFFVLLAMLVVATPAYRLEEVCRGFLERQEGSRLLRWILVNRWKFYFLVPVAAVLAHAAALPAQTGYHTSKYPPGEPPSVALLKQEVAVKVGEQFRGRVLTLAGMNRPDRDPNDEVIEVVRQYGYVLGNNHWLDLQYFNIPLANEFAHWTSPITFVFLRTFFGLRSDAFDKSVFYLRAFNERMARAMGIRLVVTDAAAIAGGTLVYETMAGETPLRIFRMDGVNLGQYSPIRLARISTAKEAIAALEAGSFDPGRDGLIEDQVPYEIVPGRLLSLSAEFGPSLSVRAESPGWSVLLLPFEYSSCLRLQSIKGQSARLIAVNLLQTGLLFDRAVEAKISYEFGPLDQPRCRDNDVKRADRLRLRDAL
jgi:hypothetical protein